MCWQLDIEIISLQGVKNFVDGFLISLVAPLSISGSFPRFHLSDGHCLCAFFRAEGSHEQLQNIITAIATNPETKKVRFVKFWGNLPVSAKEKKLSLDEFSTLATMEEGVLYEVIDLTRFQYY